MCCTHRWGRSKCSNLPRPFLPLPEAVLPGPSSGRDDKADTDWLCHHSSGAGGTTVHAQTDQDHSQLGEREEQLASLCILTHPHSLTPSQPHPLTVSHPHSVTSLQAHPLTVSPPHSLTSSQSHPLTVSHPHSLTPSQSHSCHSLNTPTPSHPHTHILTLTSFSPIYLLIPSVFHLHYPVTSSPTLLTPHSPTLTPSLPHSITSSLHHFLTPPLTPPLTLPLTPPLTGRGCSRGNVRKPDMAAGCLSLWSHWLQYPPQSQGRHSHHSGSICQIT